MEDIDMKPKEETEDKGRDRRDRDDKDGKRDRRDKSRSRERRDPGRRRTDHWEPEDSRRNGDRRSRRGGGRSRSRSRSPSRRRSTSPRSGGRRHRRSRTPHSHSRSRSRSRKPAAATESFSRSLGGPMNADPEEAAEMAKNSKRENRVYVGNLSYDVKYRDLVEFMRGAGEVLFAEVLVTPTGVSKGCGIVEFASQEDAQRSIRELSETPLLGRPIFIREDRETEARFGATPVPGKIGMAMAGQGFNAQPPPRPPHHNAWGGGPTHQNPGNQLYVGNLPYQAGWQDLKDLFRTAGNIIRADINIGADGRAKGSGTVIFETAKDAQQAISMYNGYDWYGRTLEVREDRYAGLSGGLRGGFRGGLRGGLRGGGFRGGYRGSFRGGYGGGGAERSFNQDVYADYSGPDQQLSGGGGGGGGGSGGSGGGLRMDGGGYHSGGAATFGGHGHGQPAYGGEYAVEPSQQIMVRNLPWSTAHEDLVELFETTGQVEQAEILFEGARSKGAGVVQFSQTAEAETAIAKFQQYMYGGRPLDVRYNDRWHTFSPEAAKGGQVAPMAAEPIV